MCVLVRNKWRSGCLTFTCGTVTSSLLDPPSLLEHLDAVLNLRICAETLLFLELKALRSLVPVVREVLAFPNFAFATA